MDFITEKANRFSKDHFYSNQITSEDTYAASVEEIDRIFSDLDKIKFLNIVLSKANETITLHNTLCKFPDECGEEYQHGNLVFLLTQDLNRLGVKFDQNTFSEEDKEKAESKLDKIIKDLEHLKMGQEVLLEDLTKEINELRDLYFLGKKSWHQLLVGKVVEMTAGGIISEVASKNIIQGVSHNWADVKNLIGL